MFRFAYLFLIASTLFFSCKSKNTTGFRIAAAHSVVSQNEPELDTELLHEQDAHRLWITQTFYALRYNGISVRNAWTYIDSATRKRFGGALPGWYVPMRNASDSAIRHRYKYRRVRVV